MFFNTGRIRQKKCWEYCYPISLASNEYMVLFLIKYRAPLLLLLSFEWSCGFGFQKKRRLFIFCIKAQMKQKQTLAFFIVIIWIGSILAIRALVNEAYDDLTLTNITSSIIYQEGNDKEGTLVLQNICMIMNDKKVNNMSDATVLTTHQMKNLTMSRFVHPKVVLNYETSRFKEVNFVVDIQSSEDYHRNVEYLFKRKKYWSNGKSMITVHHHTHNNFHMHNDNLLLIWKWQRIYQSDTIYIVKGDPKQRKKKKSLPPYEYVLSKMFPRGVHYPLEDKLPICFETLALHNNHARPYYYETGRGKYWPKEAFASFRDDMFHLYNIDTSLPSNHGSTPQDDSSSNKAMMTWMVRSDPRRINNVDDVIHQFSKYFNVVKIDFSDKRKKWDHRKVLQQMSITDILIGVHGAGLTYGAYMRSNTTTMMVEIRCEIGWYMRIFQNIASKLDVAYYAFDGRDYIPTESTMEFPEEASTKFAKQVWEAWQYERNNFEMNAKDGSNKLFGNGECDFPNSLHFPNGTLTPTESSRCYLEKLQDGWQQVRIFGGKEDVSLGVNK